MFCQYCLTGIALNAAGYFEINRWQINEAQAYLAI